MDPRFTLNLAIAYHAAERYADAIVFARRVMKMAAGDRRMLLVGAVRSGDALWACTSEKKLNCSKEPVLTSAEVERLDKQGQELVSAKRSEEALPIFLRAYAYSGHPRPLLRIATFEYVTGFYKDAREHALHIRRSLGDQPSKLRDEVDALIKAIEVACKKQPDECKYL